MVHLRLWDTVADLARGGERMIMLSGGEWAICDMAAFVGIAAIDSRVKWNAASDAVSLSPICPPE